MQPKALKTPLASVLGCLSELQKKIGLEVKIWPLTGYNTAPAWFHRLPPRLFKSNFAWQAETERSFGRSFLIGVLTSSSFIFKCRVNAAISPNALVNSLYCSLLRLEQLWYTQKFYVSYSRRLPDPLGMLAVLYRERTCTWL